MNAFQALCGPTLAEGSLLRGLPRVGLIDIDSQRKRGGLGQGGGLLGGCALHFCVKIIGISDR